MSPNESERMKQGQQGQGQGQGGGTGTPDRNNPQNLRDRIVNTIQDQFNYGAKFFTVQERAQLSTPMAVTTELEKRKEVIWTPPLSDYGSESTKHR